PGRPGATVAGVAGRRRVRGVDLAHGRAVEASGVFQREQESAPTFVKNGPVQASFLAHVASRRLNRALRTCGHGRDPQILDRDQAVVADEPYGGLRGEASPPRPDPGGQAAEL